MAPYRPSHVRVRSDVSNFLAFHLKFSLGTVPSNCMPPYVMRKSMQHLYKHPAAGRR